MGLVQQREHWCITSFRLGGAWSYLSYTGTTTICRLCGVCQLFESGQAGLVGCTIQATWISTTLVFGGVSSLCVLVSSCFVWLAAGGRGDLGGRVCVCACVCVSWAQLGVVCGRGGLPLVLLRASSCGLGGGGARCGSNIW